MTNKIAIVDIETSGLLEHMVDYSSFPYKLRPDANLWCIVVRDFETDEVFYAEKEQITREWLETTLAPFNTIVAHNGHKFDLLALSLFGVLDYKIGYLRERDTLFGREVKFLDTLIVSRLLSPDRFGGHSLEVWGERLGEAKTDYRRECIEAGYISAKDPKGAEFKEYNPLMLPYCIQDTKVGAKIFGYLMNEVLSFEGGWNKSLKMEHKLADLAVRRESLGFWFDKDLAVKNLEFLIAEMESLQEKVNPLLPLKPLGKTDLKYWTPPATQIKKDGTPSSHMLRFAEKVGGFIEKFDDSYMFVYEDRVIPLPFSEPIKTHEKGDISNLDLVKGYLIELGWNPSEWRIRDLTKDSKKQNLSYEKRIAALQRYLDETFAGKYKDARLEQLEVGGEQDFIFEYYAEKLREDKPVRVPTSPSVRVGVAKDLCPNLEELGEKVAFAKDFALYLTYKHRRSTIAGGDIEDMDFDEEIPNKGYLANYREIDGRIPTPAIEIGANTSRYRHISVANVPRVGSVFGKEMRSLFGCGKGFVQLGYDYASLEARIQGHYVIPYDGQELAVSLLAEKPFDVHTLTGERLGISRNDAKSINYACMYGAQANKISTMLKVDDTRGKEIYNSYWESVLPLKKLKQDLEQLWTSTGKKYIMGLDGRKINTRSKHSLINALFQSAGVICAKYVMVLSFERFEKAGYCVDPFIGKPDVCSMIEYHDEVQLCVNPKYVKCQTFETKEEAKTFVENWKGGQLTPITESKKGGYFVGLPNDFSDMTNEAIKEVEQLFNLNVEIAIETQYGRNWYECH